MMSVAVVASGHIGSDIGFAQGHGFAVVGIAVMRQAIFVAATTARVTGHFEVPVLGRLHLVRGMAVTADRAAFVPLGEELPVNALIVDLLDFDMAFAAGLRHVGLVDRRIPVHRALNVVHTVAIVAGRRDD